MELTKERLVGFYQTMTTIRTFESKTAELFAAGKIPGFVHLYIGEEAVATGVCANLADSDFITTPTAATDTSSPRAARSTS